MARLRGPGGCPWDREQTLDSIKPYTLEETYEVLEAIDNRDWDELTGELGDLLLQVLFYAQMAKEQNTFSIDEVIDRLSDKLVDVGNHVNRQDDVFAKKRQDPTDSDEPKCKRSYANSSTARLFPAKPSADINDFGQSIR